MARKLLGIGALVSLASLAQVAPAVASSYGSPGHFASLETLPETHGADRSPPGFTVNFVYNNLESLGNLQFSLRLPGIAGLLAVDVEITAAVAYSPAKKGGLTSQHWQEVFSNFGHHPNDLSFTLNADFAEVLEGSGDYVHVTGFTISLAYDDPKVSAAPLPDAVWLLGTGLLGLGCVGRRQRSS